MWSFVTKISKAFKNICWAAMAFVKRISNTILRLPYSIIQLLVGAFVALADFFLSKAKTFAQKSLVFWMVIIGIIVFSMLSYAAFYNAYVPTAVIVKPVHLSFQVCPSGVGVCSFPAANISFWNEEGTLQEVLGPGQPYSVMLSLELPESPRNRDLGMFVVAVKMFDRYNVITTASERMAMLKYYSTATRLVEFLGWLPLFFFGLKEHTQTVSVMMFPHLVDDYYHPSVGANVEVRNYGIDIYSCRLTLTAKFTGIKYFLYNWPVTSAIFAFSWNLVIFSLAIGLTMYKRYTRAKHMDTSLTSSSSQNNTPTKRKDGYEETAEIGEDDDNDGKPAFKRAKMKDSTTQTKDINEPGDMPIIQEPVDFIPEEREDEFDMDFVNEIRQRRVN